MAVYDVPLQARYDDVASTVTITGSAPPPPGPASIPSEFWFGQTGPGFTFTVPVSKKNKTTNPTAIYVVPGSEPVVRRLVEYVNGSWQMPGTIYTGP
jgi:hypothetical protein